MLPILRILNVEEKQIATLRDHIYIVEVKARCLLAVKPDGSLGVNISSGEKPSGSNSNGLLHPDSNYKRKFEQVIVQAKQITDWALQSEAHS